MKKKEIMKKLLLLVSILTLLSILSGCASTNIARAARAGDKTLVKDFLEKGVSSEEDKNIALLNAATLGYTDIAIMLLDKGADANFTYKTSGTVLSSAAKGQHIDIVKLLLDKGADVNAGGGWNPLYLSAAVGGKNNLTKLLLDKGADLNAAIAAAEGDIAGHPGCAKCISGLSLLKAIKAEKEHAGQPPVAIQKAAMEPSAIKSDIDDLPSIKVKQNKNAYAIVIGIEQYRQKLPKADFAVSDARLVSEYLMKVMGYPEENIVTLTNEHATKSDFEKYFEQWLSNNVERGGSVFIYYSGHGAPNPKTGDAYLVPYDGDPSFIDKTGYSLNRMYDALGKLPAKEIIVSLDSCFSGAGGRSVLAEGARPLVMNLQSLAVPAGNMTIMAAASGSQISSTYKEKGHGLFTYFMLKGIKNEEVVKKDGSIALGDLFSYLKPQVERIARKRYNNEQTPQLIGAKKN